MFWYCGMYWCSFYCTCEFLKFACIGLTSGEHIYDTSETHVCTPGVQWDPPFSTWLCVCSVLCTIVWHFCPFYLGVVPSVFIRPTDSDYPVVLQTFLTYQCTSILICVMKKENFFQKSWFDFWFDVFSIVFHQSFQIFISFSFTFTSITNRKGDVVVAW